MNEPDQFNDSPISSPADDLYGVNPFAEALAQRIRGLHGAVGSTIALNGPWGSGKSSIVNLIRHHLKPAEKAGELVIVNFTSWWFRGEEALTLAFLQELQAACNKTLGRRAKEIFKKARRRFTTGEAMAEFMATAGDKGWGPALAQLGGRYLTDSQSLEDVFAGLAALLNAQQKRILVIIDDIDRLTPDEALQMFRLVKSVGRLPKVMYLLVFDRDLAEDAIKERYPSEGPHFLEKIIQANFDIPPPPRSVLNEAIYAEIAKLCGEPSEADQQYFFNMFHGAVAPYIEVPRHVVRLSNAMSITYAPIAGQVNVADYLALEAMRLFEPVLYRAVRASQNALCGANAGNNVANDDMTLKRMISLVPDGRQSLASDALRRLFPRLRQMGYSHSFTAEWEANRQVCTKKHFDTYFRLQIGDEVLPREDIDKLIASAADSEAIKATFSNAAKTRRKNGKSMVPVLLDELNVHAKRIAKENVGSLLTGIFAVADELGAADPRDMGFAVGDNHMRIHWLIRRLTEDRFTLQERSDMYHAACATASFAWLVDFTVSSVTDYFPREGKEPEPEENCLVTKEDAEKLRASAVAAIRAAAANDDLLKCDRIAWMLFRWRDLLGDGGKEARDWTDRQLDDDNALGPLAKAFTGTVFSQGMGMFGEVADLVGKHTTKANLNGMEIILDKVKFRTRLEEADAKATLPVADLEAIRTILKAWRAQEANGDLDY